MGSTDRHLPEWFRSRIDSRHHVSFCALLSLHVVTDLLRSDATSTVEHVASGIYEDSDNGLAWIWKVMLEFSAALIL